MTKFFLVRHGITEWIEKGILHGISDIPLSEYGKKQAKLTAETFKDIKINRLYSSSLFRAMQTAEEISKVTSIEIEPIDGLREMDYGWLEGTRDYWSVIKGKTVLVVLNIVVRLIVSSFSGERFGKFKGRVVNAWEKIVAENSNGVVVVVAHSGVLRAILTHEFGGSHIFNPKFVLTTSSVTEIEHDEEGNMKLIEISRNSHLPGDIDL